MKPSSESDDLHHVGYQNLRRYLDNVKVQFPVLDEVVIVGESAGGFGAFAATHLAIERWPEARPSMVSISGVPLPSPVIRPCLEQRFQEAWKINDALVTMCQGSDACNLEAGGSVHRVWEAMLSLHPKLRIGLLSSLHDRVMSAYFGAGTVTACPQAQLWGLARAARFVLLERGAYEASLLALKASLADQDRFKTFFVDGSAHFLGAYHEDASMEALSDQESSEVDEDRSSGLPPLMEDGPWPLALGDGVRLFLMGDVSTASVGEQGAEDWMHAMVHDPDHWEHVAPAQE